MQKPKRKWPHKNLTVFDNGAWSKGNEKEKVADEVFGHLLRASPPGGLVSHFP